MGLGLKLVACSCSEVRCWIHGSARTLGVLGQFAVSESWVSWIKISPKA